MACYTFLHRRRETAVDRRQSEVALQWLVRQLDDNQTLISMLGSALIFRIIFRLESFPTKVTLEAVPVWQGGMTTRPSPSHLLEVIVIIVSSRHKILDSRNLYSECAWWAAMSDGSRLLELMRCGPAIPREREMVYLSPTAPRNRNTHFSIRQIPMKPMCPYLLLCARMWG